MAEPRGAGPDWKPTACADCGAPWPSWSLTGPTGPWRCHHCHTAAAPIAPAPIAAPRDDAQGSLL